MMRANNFSINTLIYALIVLSFVAVPAKSQAIYWNQTTLSSNTNNGNNLIVLTSTLTSEDIETVVTYTASLSTTTVTVGGVITQYTTWCPLTMLSFSVSQTKDFSYSGYLKSSNDIISSYIKSTSSKAHSKSVDVAIASSTISFDFNSDRYPSSSIFSQDSDSSFSITPSTITLPYSEMVNVHASNNSSIFSRTINYSSSLFLQTKLTTSATISKLSMSDNITTTSKLISHKSSVPSRVSISSSIFTSLTSSYTSFVITTSSNGNITSTQSRLPLTSSLLSYSRRISISTNYSISTISTISNGIVTLYTTWCPLIGAPHENIQNFKNTISSPLSNIITTTTYPETSVKLSPGVKTTFIIGSSFSQHTRSKTNTASVSAELSFASSASSSFSCSDKGKSFTFNTRIVTTYLHSTFTTTEKGSVTVVTTWYPVISTKIISIESCSKDQCRVSSSHSTNLVLPTQNTYPSTITVTSTRKMASIVDIPEIRVRSSTITIDKQHTTIILIESCPYGECSITRTFTTSTPSITSTTLISRCSNEICTVKSSDIQVSSFKLSSPLKIKRSSCLSGMCAMSVTNRRKESITLPSKYTVNTIVPVNSCKDDVCILSVRSFSPTSSPKSITLSMLTEINKVTSTSVTFITIESCTDSKCSITSSASLPIHTTMVSQGSSIISSKIISSIITVTATFHGIVTQYTTWCPLLVTCKDSRCELATSTSGFVKTVSSPVSVSNKYTTSTVINDLHTNTEVISSFLNGVSTSNTNSIILSTTSEKIIVSPTANGSKFVESSLSKIITSDTETNQEDKRSSEIYTGLQCTTVPESTSGSFICTRCSTSFNSVRLIPIKSANSETSIDSNTVITTIISSHETTSTITSNSYNTEVLSSTFIKNTYSIETIASSLSDSVMKPCSDTNVCHRVTSNLVTSSISSSPHTISYNLTPLITTYIGSAKRIHIFGDSIICLLLLLIM